MSVIRRLIAWLRGLFARRPAPPVPVTRPDSYAAHLARHGGMATCGNHLGVYVGTDMAATPRGWVFIPLAEATEALVKEAIDHQNRGRAAWPERET